MIPWLLLAEDISLARGSIVTVSAFTFVWYFPCVPISMFQSLPVTTSSHRVKGYLLLCMTSCQQSCQTLSAHKTTLQSPGSYNFNIEMEGIQFNPQQQGHALVSGPCCLAGSWSLGPGVDLLTRTYEQHVRGSAFRRLKTSQSQALK